MATVAPSGLEEDRLPNRFLFLELRLPGDI